MLSSDFIVFATIYRMNQADLGCTVAALVRETALSRPAVLKSIDRLLDLGMAEYEWSWEDGDGIGCAFLDLRVTEDAQGLARDLALALSESGRGQLVQKRNRFEKAKGGGASRGIPALPSIERDRSLTDMILFSTRSGKSHMSLFTESSMPTGKSSPVLIPRVALKSRFPSESRKSTVFSIVSISVLYVMFSPYAYSIQYVQLYYII